MSRRTALGQVLGLGSAKEGVEHWWAQRVSAVALALLGVWFAFSVAGLARAGQLDHAGLAAWLQGPVAAVFTALFIGTAAWHSNLGTQVIIEDYVDSKPLKVGALMVTRFIHAALGAIGIYAVLRISFGGAA